VREVTREREMPFDQCVAFAAVARLLEAFEALRVVRASTRARGRK
jgi:hypothetical protein